MFAAEFFLGYAKIDLDAFHFEHSAVSRQRRRESVKNVDRLVLLFNKVGCQNEREEHSVVATLSDADLREALVDTEHTELPKVLSSALDVPHLNVLRVNGVQGLHRVAAARRVLKGARRWWLVRLYSTDLPAPTLTEFASFSVQERQETDGDILRHILLHHGTAEEHRWRGRLTGSPSKLKDVNQLLKNAQFMSAFRKLSVLRSLWTPIELGSLHRFLTLRCDEEILNALKHLHDAWQHIFSGVPTTIHEQLDIETVDFLEAMAPAISVSDSSLLRKRMQSGELFARVKSEQVRQRLLLNLLAYRHMIPTLRSVFEGLKQLEPACSIMKRLAGVNGRQTIQQSLCMSYQDTSLGPIELGERNWHKGTWSAPVKKRYFLYVQLWVYALRNCYFMSEYTPRKEIGRRKPEAQKLNTFLQQRLGKLAVESGFETAAAGDWSQDDPMHDLLDRLSGDISIGIGSSLTPTDKEKILAALPNDESQSNAVPVTYLASESLPKERLSGRPFEHDYHDDRRALFLYNILSKNIDQVDVTVDPGSECPANGPYFVTSLFARRELLYCFFGVDLDLFLPDVLSGHYDDCPSTMRYRPGSPLEGEGGETTSEVHTRKIIELQNLVLNLQRQVQDAQRLAAERQEHLSTLENVVLEQNVKDAGHVAESALNRQRIAELERQLERSERSLYECTAKLEAIHHGEESRNEDESRLIDNLEARVRDLEQALQASFKLVEDGKNESSKLQGMVGEHNTRSEQLAAELSSSQQRVSQLEEQISRTAEDQMSRESLLQRKLHDLEEELSKTRAQVKDLESGQEIAETRHPLEPIPTYQRYSQDLIELMPQILRISKGDLSLPKGIQQLHSKYWLYTLHFQLPNDRQICFVDTSNGPVLPSLLDMLQRAPGWSLQAGRDQWSRKKIEYPCTVQYVQDVLDLHGELWVVSPRPETGPRKRQHFQDDLEEDLARKQPEDTARQGARTARPQAEQSRTDHAPPDQDKSQRFDVDPEQYPDFARSRISDDDSDDSDNSDEEL